MLAFAICMAVGLGLEFVLRCLVGEWWPLPWFILIMAAQVVAMVIPDRHYARFRTWLDRPWDGAPMTKAEWITALRCCPVAQVVMPTAVPLLALLGEQDLGWKWVKLLAVYWAVMGPLLLLQLHLDRKEKESDNV